MKYGDCEYVYNVILHGGKAIVINGIKGLGHGFDGRGSEEFFGNLDAICGGPLRNWRQLKRDGVLSGELLGTQRLDAFVGGRWGVLVTAKLWQPMFIYSPEMYWDVFGGNKGSSRMET